MMLWLWLSISWRMLASKAEKGVIFDLWLSIDAAKQCKSGGFRKFELATVPDFINSTCAKSGLPIPLLGHRDFIDWADRRSDHQKFLKHRHRKPTLGADRPRPRGAGAANNRHLELAVRVGSQGHCEFSEFC
jgi:hypothetical protein